MTFLGKWVQPNGVGHIVVVNEIFNRKQTKEKRREYLNIRILCVSLASLRLN